MAVEKTERSIGTLIDNISSAEIRLPEIQRGYVWKPPQVAKLIESLYRGYPSGSLLFWRTDETPQTRDVAANAPTANPAVSPLYLLDGQQRLTSLHRVLTDHPEAQIVFDVEQQRFQNQSAATRRDARWVKVFDLVHEDADLFELTGRLRRLCSGVADNEIYKRLDRVAKIRDYGYHLEILTGLPYEEVAQIFVRVNSGGRSLKTTDLALATLSARWPGILHRIEDEARHWRQRGYGDLDVTFITRALTGAVLGRGLSAWSHGRLVNAPQEQLDAGWATVQRGLRHLVPLLRDTLKVTTSRLLPSVNVLLPLVVLLGERPDEPLDAETANGILYWFLVATLRNRYSGSADTRLGIDIPAARQPDPVRALLSNLGVVGTQVTVTEQALIGRSVASPYFFASFLVMQRNTATDWWYGTATSALAEGSQKLQYHHIHPRSTLRKDYTKAEINDLANLAFISGKANLKISNRSPEHYFADLAPDVLSAHLVPLDQNLRTADQYREFLAARRRLLAAEMTALLDTYRPAWLDAAPPGSPDDLTGCTLDLTLYDGGTEGSRLLAVATTPQGVWRGVLDLDALDASLAEAATGIESELAVSDAVASVRPVGDEIEVVLGPFVVFGSAQDWKAALERERADPESVNLDSEVAAGAWGGELRRFPISSSE